MASLVQKVLTKTTVAAAASAPIAAPAGVEASSAPTNPAHVRMLDADPGVHPNYPQIPRAELRRMAAEAVPGEQYCAFVPGPIWFPMQKIEPAGQSKGYQTFRAAGLDPDPNVTYQHNLSGSVSPDGKTYAVTVWKSGLQLVDAGTKAATVVYKYENERERVQRPVWSPDGSKIAFVVFEPNGDPAGGANDTFKNCRVVIRDRAGKNLVDQPIAGFGQVTWTKDSKGVVTALSEPTPQADPPAARVRVFGLDVASGKKTFEWTKESGKNPSHVRAVLLTKNDTEVVVVHVDVPNRGHKQTTFDKAGAAKTFMLPPSYMDAGSDRAPQSDLGVPTGNLIEFKSGKVVYCPESSHGKLFDIASSNNVVTNWNGPGLQFTAVSPDGERIVSFGRNETFGDTGWMRIYETKIGWALSSSVEFKGKGRMLDVKWISNDSFVVLLAETAGETSESVRSYTFNVKKLP